MCPQLAAAFLLRAVAETRLASAAGDVHHLVLDLVRHHQECRVHERARLRGCLEERDVQRLRKLPALRLRHLPQARLALRVAEVRLVADQQLVDVLPRVLVDLRQPPLHVVEGLQAGHVVHNDNAVRAAVVGAADRAEALLARRVPDLQLDRLSIQLYRADLEVHADGGDVAVCPFVIRKSQQEARLAHTRVADEDEDEEVVV
eukprot:CAMPEP_0113273928 /NCGR_PEP_ID=MMETSP0008_2-20120614/24120_1 /TAXON_ID=97485 /ORGANISM="Prymnesium parvum" /LENGTH=202 /DNA_ID=CAMNT_0000123493 /DNA_START=423 /DNA_END=1031 /DNA_ORIENTATION=+ /assembly_acc=CAM_ASM_000153